MSAEKNQNVSLIGVPLGYGASQVGSELGVSAIRHSRIRGRLLVEHIRDLGYDVKDRGDVDIMRPLERAKPGDNPKFLPEMLTSCRNIFETVSAIVADGDLPIILGGEHSIAIGTYPAVASALISTGEVGLLWFDAHADMNTPETSPTGNIHGMPLAVLFGHGDPQL